jgi:hypothetical protein
VVAARFGPVDRVEAAAGRVSGGGFLRPGLVDNGFVDERLVRGTPVYRAVLAFRAG